MASISTNPSAIVESFRPALLPAILSIFALPTIITSIQLIWKLVCGLSIFSITRRGFGKRSISGRLKKGKSTEPKRDGATRALSVEYYESEQIYQLERRAIFSRKWQVITHKARLQDKGDFHRFDVAGYDFFLVKDRKENKIMGFHNVCRHRAFPLITKDSGNAKILSCRYHGWSYGTNGKLAKAPGYDQVEGFDKDQNGLYPIHVHVDKLGFVWINLDAKKVPEISWQEDFEGIDEQERYKEYNFPDYVWDHDWNMESAYNWKLSADNYNECYHCETSHPDIGAVANLESYSVSTRRMNIVHDPATTEEQRKAGLVVASTYYFPNASTNVTPHFFMVQRFVPTGPNHTKMQYQFFRNKHSSDDDFNFVVSIYKRVMTEDKELCEKAQKNLSAGVFVNGELHPTFEKGPLFFQKCVRETIEEHRAREVDLNMEISPARRMPTNNAEQTKEDIAFCQGLSCSEVNKELQW